MSEIFWVEATRPLKDLIEYKHNPRRINKQEFDALVEDIKRDGYHNRIKINADNVIIGGDKRKKALKEAGYGYDDMIPVLVPNRMLTESEFKRLNIQDNLHRGTFDFDILANEFDHVDLIDWGMNKELFPKMDDLTIEDTEPQEESKKKKFNQCPNCKYEYEA